MSRLTFRFLDNHHVKSPNKTPNLLAGHLLLRRLRHERGRDLRRRDERPGLRGRGRRRRRGHGGPEAHQHPQEDPGAADEALPGARGRQRPRHLPAQLPALKRLLLGTLSLQDRLALRWLTWP